MSIYSPDLALRQPLTLAALFPLFLGYYAQAVLAILPNTFTFKVSLLPFILWQAWRCSVGFDFGSFLAPLLGHRGTDRVAFWNFIFVVMSLQRIISFGEHFAETSGAGFGIQHSVEDS
jgi:hypothetical protein